MGILHAVSRLILHAHVGWHGLRHEHDGVVDYNYDEDGTSDLYGYTQTGPIKNVLKFVSDIKTINFPDIEFFEDYKEFQEVCRSGKAVIPEYIGSQKDKYERDDAIRSKLWSFLMEVIRLYANDGVNGINKYIEELTTRKRWKSSRITLTTAWTASSNTLKRLPRGRCE